MIWTQDYEELMMIGSDFGQGRGFKMSGGEMNSL